MDNPNSARRGLILGAAAVGALATGAAFAQTVPDASDVQRSIKTQTGPDELDGKTMPEPSPSLSAGPIVAGRGSNIAGKVAVVTGAARGIGRAIAVELAANGADVVALDIAGPVSPASNAVPATPEELNETVQQIRAFGRRGEAVRADIRDIAALRAVADAV